MKIKKLLFLLYIPLMIQVSIYSNEDYKVKGIKKILYLNSYHKGYEWSDQVTKGIEEVFYHKNIYLDIEYLDTKREFSIEYQEQLINILRYKHTEHKYDLIITSDNNAFDLVYRNRDIFNETIPIVFCGLNFVEKGLYENQNITGINEDIDITANIELIRGMHPKTKNIYVITDNTTTGKIIQNKVNKVAKSITHINIEPVFNKSMDEITTLVNNLDELDVVFFTNFARDSIGDYYDTAVATHLVTDKSIVPVYGAWDFQINHGIVGGIVITGYDQGVSAANIALKVLNGLSANDIPIIYKAQKKLYFDYTALKRFNMTHRSLPRNSNIINIPKTFYNQNRKIILISFGVFIFLFIIIILTVYSLIRSKKAEQKLSKYQNGLEILVEKRTEELKESIDVLKKTQNQLIESEKITSLGILVSGVAHEINTPISIGVTAANHFEEITNTINLSLSKNQLTQTGLNNYLKDAKEISRLLQNSLNKSAKLIATFKEISGMSNEKKQNINIKQLVYSTLNTHFPRLDKKRYNWDLKIEEDIDIISYPGAITTVIRNLIQNSIQHGFEDRDSGLIEVEIKHNKRLIEIIYKDTGHGIPEENLSKIFEPFFTTISGKGTHGLGLHLVYKLITQTLKGTITCFSNENSGVLFNIQFPID